MPSSSKWLLSQKRLESIAWSFTGLSCSALNSDFVVNVPNFVFKLELFTRLETLDLSTYPFSFAFVSSISIVKSV